MVLPSGEIALYLIQRGPSEGSWARAVMVEADSSMAAPRMVLKIRFIY